jgi:trimeric autotransporter adhesin
MPVNLPDSVTHNNPAYPIVVSEDLGGTARVITGTLNNTNLLSISSFKRAKGTIVFSETDLKYYTYQGLDTLDVNWGDVSNWIDIGSGGGGTLDQVTTAGNTTTNAITVGGLTVDTNVLVVDPTNDRVGIGTTTPAYRVDAQGTLATHAIRSHIGYDIYPVPEPTSLTAVVSAGGSVNTGLHGYYVTFITALGETRPRFLFGTTTTAGNNTVTLTLPISSDPRVTGRKIYRTKAGSNYNEYLLATINDNVTTTFVDTAADSTLTLQYRGSYYRANTTNQQITLAGQRSMLIDQNATYFGLRAGESITSGGYNVFLGTWAGLSMTTGLSNTFIGYYSASLTTTGNDNVVIGTTASYNATTLNRNVVLGTLAGRYHTGGSANITTMTDSIFIGMRSYAASATPSNTIVIGNQVDSLGDNTVVLGNSSIVRTALRGNVLIGTTTDVGYKLQVQGTVSAQLTNATHADQVYYNSATGELTYGAAAGGSTPTLDQVTTAGNTTTNAITVGGLTVDTNVLVVDSVNDRVVIGATTATNKLEIFGTGTSGGVSSNVGYNIQPVDPPNITGMTYTLLAGTALSVGRYWYHIIYYNAIGETSRSTSFRVDTTTGNQVVQLNNIPISSNPSVIGRNIYRGKVGDSASYGARIGTIANNVDTTFVDSISDSNPIIPSYVLDRPIHGKPNTTSKYISVFGVRSMIVDSTGLTTFGYQAGEDIFSAGQTTLFGFRAGANITTRGGNTLFGYNAGSTITTGSQNVGMGDNALVGVTTGSYNIGLGPNVLQRDGSFNIAMGYFTGQQTTGNNNIMIGSYIGSSTLAMNNSVIIGHSATPLAATNNQINIANTIYGRSNTGNVQIGTTTDAGYKLDVNGNTKISGNIYLNDIPNRYIYGYNGTYIKLYDNTTGGLDIYNLNGTSPTRNYGKLEVFGNLTTTGSFTMSGNLNIGNGNYLTANPSNYNRIYPYNGSNANMRFVLSHPTVGDFDWEYPLGTVLVRLKRNGNLLIGTTTDAGYKLDVNGSVRASNFTVPNLGYIKGIGYGDKQIQYYYGTWSVNGNFNVNGLFYQIGDPGIVLFQTNQNYNGSSIYITGQENGYFSQTNGTIWFKRSRYATEQAGYIKSATVGTPTSSDYESYMAFGTTPSGSIVSSERMRIASGGNVLIGTTTDSGYKLDVNGTIRSNNVITASGGNSTDWNTAFGWGDHAAAGYITGTTGFTGVFTIPTNPPGQQNLDIQNGLIINVF